MTEEALSVGTQLDDFEITEVLGQGGFGVTYKAVDRRLQRNVAIKEYLPREFAFRDEQATVRARTAKDEGIFNWGLTRFIDEARALAKFKHPSIVAVIRYFEANGTAYLVMEYEEGKDLERWIKGGSEAMSERALIDRIVLPLLDGLAKIHDAGLLHRDIKPENVFIRRDGSPLLIDFGSSRPHGQGQSSNLTSIVSAGYSPFEQYGVAQRQGPWSDVYAFGGTLYRLVVGKPPTDAIARQQGVDQPAAAEMATGRYSERFLRAIDRALAMDPAERPQSAAEFRALLPTQTSTPTETDATVVRRVTVGRTSYRMRFVAIVVSVVVSVALGVGLLWPTIGQRESSSPSKIAVSAGVESVADTRAEPASNTGEVIDAARTEVGSKESADEQSILAGWSVPPEVADYRDNQIAGALLAYASNKERFDECLASACADQAALMAKISDALQGYAWTRAEYRGVIRLANPRRLSNAKCPIMIDVDETLSDATSEHNQQRTYCTRNGFDRRVESAGPVSDRPIVQTPG
jgi:serine/threonine protein kinase